MKRGMPATALMARGYHSTAHLPASLSASAPTLDLRGRLSAIADAASDLDGAYAALARDVLDAARATGVRAFSAPSSTGHEKILLASLGIDLSCSATVRALWELNRRGLIQLLRVEMPDTCQGSLVVRGLDPTLLGRSRIVDGPSWADVLILPAAEVRS